MRTLSKKKRGCGYRRKGGLYLVAETGDGILPVWTNIDPPVPYLKDDGTPGEQFRGTIQVSLESLLAGLSMSEYLAGASADRKRKEVLRDPEIRAFGMPLSTRESVGVCLRRGLDALRRLHCSNVQSFGYHMRSLSNLSGAKGLVEVTTAWTDAQNGNWKSVLAAMWRLWRGSSKKGKQRVRTDVAGIMYVIGAQEDVEAL